jgi:hypothetical protein
VLLPAVHPYSFCMAPTIALKLALLNVYVVPVHVPALLEVAVHIVDAA